MIYDSTHIYGYGQELKRISITDQEIEKIKLLRSTVEKSSYYDYMLQWKLEDNLDIVKNTEELSKLFLGMQFIAMLAEVGEIKSIDLKEHHVNLLRRLYLDMNDDMITMCYKRPFGNSHVLGDVLEETNPHISLDDDYDYKNDLKNLCFFLMSFLKDLFI